MNVIFGLTVLIIICWLLISLFRLLVDRIEHFVDLSARVSVGEEKNRTADNTKDLEKIQKKAA